ncbi:MAG: NADH-quinone oxidoreductase subunit N [Herpetosiphonaceae bacterium]|nr:MAG: NADH-quinone oxidoreductase subunit N [Herpetosiphonaceae bacterium]
MIDYLRLSEWGITSLIALSPLVGMLLALLLPERDGGRAIKWGVFLWSLVPLGLVLYLWWGGLYDPNATAPSNPNVAVIQLVDKVDWIRAPIRADYFVGIDGLNLPLVILTAVLGPIAVLASFGITTNIKTYFALLMLVQTAMLGYFTALNFLLFFLFWEFSLVPMFFIINNWGGPNRSYAAFKFFVYTMAGSLGMLLIFQFLYLATGTFDLVRLARLGAGIETINGLDLKGLIFNYVERLGITGWLGTNPDFYAGIVFWAIFIAFAVKLAVWPFHTWLPDAYSQAPTAGSMLLAGVMSKMGAYGMLRLALPLLPDAAQEAAPAIAILGLAGVLLGAYAGLAQWDLKRLIGYTSINHMGLVAIGIAAAAAAGSTPLGVDARAGAINGVQMMMIGHGLSTAALFYFAGALYARTGTYDLRHFGGLRMPMPLFAGAMGVAMFANLGLPGLADFVGEFFIFLGAWATLPLIAVIAVIGLIASALLLLLMFQRIFYGPVNTRWLGLSDLSRFELFTALPLLLLLLVFGVYPALLLDLANQTSLALVSIFAR